MNTTKDDNHGAVTGQVERRVRPGLADALDAWWEAAYAEGREGRTHDTEGGAAQAALQDIWAAHSAQIAAAVAAERKRMRALVAEDAWSCTFQTFGQYRAALMKALMPNVGIERLRSSPLE